jgi:hypothetical protein
LAIANRDEDFVQFVSDEIAAWREAEREIFHDYGDV